MILIPLYLHSKEGKQVVKRPIRDLQSDCQPPPRFCDIVVDGDTVYLEQKRQKNKYVKILWDDLIYQVEAAKKANKD